MAYIKGPDGKFKGSGAGGSLGSSKTGKGGGLGIKIKMSSKRSQGSIDKIMAAKQAARYGTKR
jgi:hypothetical protein